MKNIFRRAMHPRLTSRSLFWRKSLKETPHPAEMAGEGEMRAAGAVLKSGKDRAPFLERAWTWLHATFPERQIYIRSDGRVQFFTFGPSLQATLAGLTLIFLGWVAFATVNVIFKDRIIAAKDHRYQQMQAAYENRVADLQMSYDELNGALVLAQDRFKATADNLTAKQNAIMGLVTRAGQVQSLLKDHDAPLPPAATAPAPARMSGALDVEAPADIRADDIGSSALIVMPAPPPPQPRTGRVLKSGLLAPAWEHFAGLFESVIQKFHIGTHPVGDSAQIYNQHPALRVLAGQTARLAALARAETPLMIRTRGVLAADVGGLRQVMARAGINPDGFARKIAGGEGGPEIPLDQVRIEGVSDPGFTEAYLGAAAVLDQLNGLSAAMDHVPLIAPVSARNFEESSGFGPRIDPFTGRYAFHPGVDFAGPWGATVYATAPGIVVFAGPHGGYGNLVEIDHGYGIHTRYGHLSAITVAVGARIAKGQSLGRVGSTGRSTGSHVHYEVWYDDVVKNPSNFLEAGRHVF